MTRVLLCILSFGFFISQASWAQEFQSKQPTGGTSAGIVQTQLVSEDISSEPLPPLPPGPLLLTSTTPEQLSPDYWISRLPNPDRVLKTPEELEVFNKEIRMMIRERRDIFEPGILPTGKHVRDQLELEYETVSKRFLFDTNGVRIPKSFFVTQIKPTLQWERVRDQLTPKWGAAIRATSVRALPTNFKMLEEVGDIEFDQLQFTLIKLWTPVVILHTSSDGEWCYVQAPYVRGWVRSRDIAVFPDKMALEHKVRTQKFIVVTGESVPVCYEEGCASEFQRPSMGTVLPLIEKSETGYIIDMPIRVADGNVVLRHYYVSRSSDVHEGFPAFTQANMIRQAFKLLSARYGWGGMYNGRDCSGFTHDVFLSLGVDLPRDSDQQALAGTQLGHFEPHEDQEKKAAALRAGTPAITLLKMPLHMMLYLGEMDGKFYVIHSTWAERISMTSDEKRRINQVIVSDLSLNGNSYLGSLFDRIISINELN